MESGVFSQTPIIVLILSLIAVLLLILFIPFSLWISALTSGVTVHLFTLIRMRVQGIRPDTVVKPFILARLAAVNVTIQQLEKHYRAGGDLENTINGIIVAIRADVSLSVSEAAKLDLADEYVLLIVQKEVSLREVH